MATSEIQSLHRAVAILDCFCASQPELGVREIARQLKLHPSTVGRMVATMTSLGILDQDIESHRYRMGSMVLKWGAVYMNNLDIRAAAHPYLEDLYNKTQETVSLYIMEGYQRICIDRFDSPQTVRMVAHVGERLPLMAGASGKVLLAFQLPELRESILKNLRLERLTATTIVDIDVLRKELDAVEKRGYAISHGERTDGASGVAAPIFDASNRIVASMNVSGPTTRFTKLKLRTYIELLLQSTTRLSTAMGYPVPTISASKKGKING